MTELAGPVTTVLAPLDLDRLDRARRLVSAMVNLEHAENNLVRPAHLYNEDRAYEQIRAAFDYLKEAALIYLADIGEPDHYDIPF